MAATEAAFELLKPGTAEIPAMGTDPMFQSLELPRQVASERRSLERVPVVTETRPSSRPERIHLGALKDPRYRLRKAIPLDVSVEESEVVLTWPEVDEFGHGETTSAALDDFGQTLRELYCQLHAPEVQLGADLQSVRQVLEEYIEPRTK